MLEMQGFTIITVIISDIKYDNKHFSNNRCNFNSNMLISVKILYITFDIQKRINNFLQLDLFNVTH